MSLFMLARVVVLFSFIFGPCAFGYDFGGMSGGGGGLIKDMNNPWFLENTKRVSYCIQIDPATFTPDINYVRSMITRAFDYWKSNFSDAFVPRIAMSFPPVLVATQSFYEVSCNQSPDIRFQMGQLSPAQREFFDDPTLYAGAAFRESYDPMQMKGRGFIYISPDLGPMRFSGISANIPDFWRLGRGGLLFRTLVHELGHVFGLTHMGDDEDIMGDRFVETMMLDKHYQSAAERLELPDFFKFRGSKASGTAGTGVESFSPETQAFFGLPSDANGISLHVKDARTITVKAAKRTDHSAPLHLFPIGEIALEEADALIWIGGVTVYLPEGQKALQVPPALKLKTIWGAQRTTEVRPGIFRSLDGRTVHNVIMHMMPGGPQYFVGGVIGNRPVPNVIK